MRRRLAILVAGVCLFSVSEARASTLFDTLLALQVSTPSDSVTFPIVTGVLSWSTGPFTVGDYTISNITEEFVGSGFPNVTDPLQFRLTGIGSITCDPCTEPLEIDFAALGIPPTDSGFYLDLATLMVTIGMEGSLGKGNDVPAELILLFPDLSFFDQSMTLTAGQPFSLTSMFGPVGGQPGVVGSFFLGCDCSTLAPGQVFSAPDSISVTFNTPEPASWMLAAIGLLGMLLGTAKLRQDN